MTNNNIHCAVEPTQNFLTIEKIQVVVYQMCMLFSDEGMYVLVTMMCLSSWSLRFDQEEWAL